MPRDSPLPRREGSICLSDRRVELEDQIKALRKTAESEGWHVDRDAILLRIRDENGQRLQPLGSGSMGVVHRAELQGRGFVAAKSARSDLDLVQDLQAREDLLSEIAVLRRVGAHPHVVAFLGANLTSDAPMLLLQICEGGTVGDVFRRKRAGWQPRRATALAWAAQLCRALEFLHARDPPLLHRDVKPDNLFLSADLATLRLGDFGLARDRWSESEAGELRAMTALTGSLNYMAPEVLESRPFYDERSDVYSAAVCIFALCTGRTMQLQSVAEARERVVSASERPPLEATVDGPTARVLASMWGGDPESRIPAGAAAAEFDSLLRWDEVGRRVSPGQSRGLPRNSSFNVRPGQLLTKAMRGLRRSVSLS